MQQASEIRADFESNFSDIAYYSLVNVLFANITFYLLNNKKEK